eukprot:COSAG01_NODE_9730_length_2360_cov_3.984962_3_plen_352_part_00
MAEILQALVLILTDHDWLPDQQAATAAASDRRKRTGDSQSCRAGSTALLEALRELGTIKAVVDMLSPEPTSSVSRSGHSDDNRHNDDAEEEGGEEGDGCLSSFSPLTSLAADEPDYAIAHACKHRAALCGFLNAVIAAHPALAPDVVACGVLARQPLFTGSPRSAIPVAILGAAKTRVVVGVPAATGNRATYREELRQEWGGTKAGVVAAAHCANWYRLVCHVEAQLLLQLLRATAPQASAIYSAPTGELTGAAAAAAPNSSQGRVAAVYSPAQRAQIFTSVRQWVAVQRAVPIIHLLGFRLTRDGGGCQLAALWLLRTVLNAVVGRAWQCCGVLAAAALAFVLASDDAVA